ncbi:hypothetical protein [Pseudomonas sp. KU43P]|uniref:hypothetical protein n=1 Tax=Pseudomonas sp. KU43P TaxID=2487887 RepID=UPI0012A7B796|nr:hypothetical protein [Pseudomonas sp. KU43P]BBH48199.1 decarboxylase [Pseudomonas sp. KU43P]
MRNSVPNQTAEYLFSSRHERLDLWCDLLQACRNWVATNSCDPSEAGKKAVGRLLAGLQPLEHFHAYPGQRLMAILSQRIAEHDDNGAVRLAQRICSSLLDCSYRHDLNDWDPADDLPDASPARISINQSGPVHRPYFELLLVNPDARTFWPQRLQDIRNLRRDQDEFIYEPIIAGTFEDALMAAILNPDVQVVVIHDGFLHDADLSPRLRYMLQQYQALYGGAQHDDPSIELAITLNRIRPELNIILLRDRDVEKTAGNHQLTFIDRVFYEFEEPLEVHLCIIENIANRYRTPFFDNLKRYARRPIGTFHALPVARGKSIFKSNWIRDMGAFYGANLFLAESSATTGGLDSLLEPTGNIREAQRLAAHTFGANEAYFVTNGTSTANKIVEQALLAPGDIVLIDRNCHKSHHYAAVLTGALPFYIDAYPLSEYSMYGGVPLRSLKEALLNLKQEGKLDRAKMMVLTNCTFDGHVYNPVRVMEECLAIKPDLIFLWDEAWFGFARFSPLLRQRTAMYAATELRKRLKCSAYRQRFDLHCQGLAVRTDDNLLDEPLLMNPDVTQVRVYQTNSVHKSMSALRQGSMILVNDDNFAQIEEPFREALFTHTSTSPNQQIIASLDIARRQMELEGYDLVMRATQLAFIIRREVNGHPLISRYFRIFDVKEMIPEAFRGSQMGDYGLWSTVGRAIAEDEFFLDPTRLTLSCGHAGFDGTELKQLLAKRYNLQVNKTSRNSVLMQTNINNTRSDVAHLLQVLVSISQDIDQRIKGKAAEARKLERRVVSLVEEVPKLPNFSHFHPAFRSDVLDSTVEGDIRKAFYRTYDPDACEHVRLFDSTIDERLNNGPSLVSANFVIPYPPGFPIMVPGQVLTAPIIDFMRNLDVREVHGYNSTEGLKLLKPDRLQ